MQASFIGGNRNFNVGHKKNNNKHEKNKGAMRPITLPTTFMCEPLDASNIQNSHLWYSLLQINQPNTNLHELYYRKISIYRSRIPLTEQIRIRDEFEKFYREKWLMATNGGGASSTTTTTTITQPTTNMTTMNGSSNNSSNQQLKQQFQVSNYPGITFKQRMELLLLEFVIIYLSLSEDTANHSRAMDQLNRMNGLMDQLKHLNLENCNLMALCHNIRGIVYHYNNKMDMAVEEYTRAIQICPTFTVAYNNRAVSYQRLDKHELSLMDDTKAIDMDPTYAPAYNNRGNTFFFQSNWKWAIADYTKTIELDEYHSDAYFNRALVHQLCGNQVLALKDASHARELKCGYDHATSLCEVVRMNILQKCADTLLPGAEMEFDYI